MKSWGVESRLCNGHWVWRGDVTPEGRKGRNPLTAQHLPMPNSFRAPFSHGGLGIVILSGQCSAIQSKGGEIREEALGHKRQLPLSQGWMHPCIAL